MEILASLQVISKGLPNKALRVCRQLDSTYIIFIAPQSKAIARTDYCLSPHFHTDILCRVIGKFS